MSDSHASHESDFEKKLTAIQKKIHEKQKQKEEAIKSIETRSGNHFNVDLLRGTVDYETEFKLIDGANRDVSQLTAEYTNLLLGSTEDLLKTLNTSSAQLEETTRRQVEATKAVVRYSARLDALTSALLILTAVLAVVSFSEFLFPVYTDEGFSANLAVAWVSIGDLILVGILLVVFTFIGRRVRKEAAELEKSLTQEAKT